jgi:hypothetical protein
MVGLSLDSCKGNFDGLVLPSDPNITENFTGKALRVGARCSWLNPPNEGQGYASRFIGKPIRAVARLVYALVVTTVLPPLSVVYHALAVAGCSVMANIASNQGKIETERSYGLSGMYHFQAATADVVFITSMGGASAVASYQFMQGGQSAADVTNTILDGFIGHMLCGNGDKEKYLKEALGYRGEMAEVHQRMLKENMSKPQMASAG